MSQSGYRLVTRMACHELVTCVLEKAEIESIQGFGDLAQSCRLLAGEQSEGMEDSGRSLSMR